MAFHGCGDTPKNMARGYDTYGITLLAATNDIIVVYPGSKQCFNDDGAFDSEHWLTNQGLYPETMRSVICRLTTEEGSEEAANCPERGPFPGPF